MVFRFLTSILLASAASVCVAALQVPVCTGTISTKNTSTLNGASCVAGGSSGCVKCSVAWTFKSSPDSTDKVASCGNDPRYVNFQPLCSGTSWTSSATWGSLAANSAVVVR